MVPGCTFSLQVSLGDLLNVADLAEEFSEMLTGDPEAYKPFEVSPPVVKPKTSEDETVAATPDVSTPTQVATPAEAEEGLESLAEQLETLKAPSTEEHKSSFEPFKRPNADFGVPDSPLFGITQLGVDKRLVSRLCGLTDSSSSIAS